MTQTLPPTPPNVMRIQRELRRARTYLDAGNPMAASAVAENLTQQFPRLGLGWFYRSLAEAAESRLPAAIASAERDAPIWIDYHFLRREANTSADAHDEHRAARQLKLLRRCRL